MNDILYSSSTSIIYDSEHDSSLIWIQLPSQQGQLWMSQKKITKNQRSFFPELLKLTVFPNEPEKGEWPYLLIHESSRKELYFQGLPLLE